MKRKVDFKNRLLSKSKALNAVGIIKLENQHFATPNKNHNWAIIIIRNFIIKGSECHHLNS